MEDWLDALKLTTVLCAYMVQWKLILWAHYKGLMPNPAIDAVYRWSRQPPKPKVVVIVVVREEK